MDREPTRQHWQITATRVLEDVMAVERRFSASISVNKTTMLAAADELEAATREASIWMRENPCPNPKFGAHIDLTLTLYAEIALTAQQALLGPLADFGGAMSRLSDLLTIIDFYSDTLDEL